MGRHQISVWHTYQNWLLIHILSSFLSQNWFFIYLLKQTKHSLIFILFFSFFLFLKNKNYSQKSGFYMGSSYEMSTSNKGCFFLNKYLSRNKVITFEKK